MKTLFGNIDPAQRDKNDSIVKYDIYIQSRAISLAQRVSKAIKGIAGIDQGNRGWFEVTPKTAVFGLFIQPR